MRHFRTLLAAVLAIVGATTGVAQTTYNLWLAGTQVTSNHLSGDPTSAVVDVTGLVNIILGKDNNQPYVYDHEAADVNEDSLITIADVTALVNIILGK